MSVEGALTITRLFRLNALSSLSEEDPILIDESNTWEAGGAPLSLSQRDLGSCVVDFHNLLVSAAEPGATGIERRRYVVVMPNCAEYVVAFLGIAYGRAQNCLLNPSFSLDELLFAAQDMGCDGVLIGGIQQHPQAEELAAKLGVAVIRLNLRQEKGATQAGRRSAVSVIVEKKEPGTAQWKKVQRLDDSSLPECPVAEGSDVVLKLHTSGTTSRPKTVPIRHSNVVASCLNMRSTYRWDPESDCGLLVMPLFHVHGLFNGCIAPLSAGVKIIIPQSRAFSREPFWRAVAKHNPTWVTAVPSIWQILMNSREGGKTPRANFRYIRGCSSSLAEPLAAELEKVFDTEVLEAYAMTEATHQMCSNVPGSRRFGSVGYPQGTHVIIVSPETKQVQQMGEPGEVCITGWNVISAYEGLSEDKNRENFYDFAELVAPKDETKCASASTMVALPPAQSTADETFAAVVSAYHFDTLTDIVLSAYSRRVSSASHKFLRTGDVGVMDETGRISLVGRIKELINRGGEKISPLEIDSVLLECGLVREAGTFAQPDPILGEAVAACIVLKEDCSAEDPAAIATTIRNHCANRLAKFKVPAQLFFSSELPKGPTGKTLRRELAAFVLDKKLTTY